MSRWYDLFGVEDALAEIRLAFSNISGKLETLLDDMIQMKRRQKIMELALQQLIDQVRETKTVMESAVLALRGVIARLDALIKHEESEGLDPEVLEALRVLRQELADATPALASAIAEVPAVNPVEPQ